MRLKCPHETLNKALTLVQRGLASKSIMPGLAAIHLSADSEGIFLSTNNLQLSVKTKVPCEVMEQGEVLVAGKYFIDLFRHLPPVEIELSTDENTLKINYNDSQVTMQLLSREAFPEIPDLPSGEIILNRQAFCMISRRVAVACSTEQGRPTFTGVLFDFNEVGLAVVASDTHRLALYILKQENITNINKKILVPGTSLTELAHLAEGSEKETLDLRVGERYLGLRFGETTMITRLLEGVFPDYRLVIPTNFETKVIVKGDIFLQSLIRASLVAREDGSSKSNVIILNVSGNTLFVKAEAPDVGKINEPMEVEFFGEPLEMSFNVKYLTDALKVMESEEVEILFSGGGKAAVLHPLGEPEYTHLVLPIVRA